MDRESHKRKAEEMESLDTSDEMDVREQTESNSMCRSSFENDSDSEWENEVSSDTEELRSFNGILVIDNTLPSNRITTEVSADGRFLPVVRANEWLINSPGFYANPVVQHAIAYADSARRASGTTAVINDSSLPSYMQFLLLSHEFECHSFLGNNILSFGFLSFRV